MEFADRNIAVLGIAERNRHAPAHVAMLRIVQLKARHPAPLPARPSTGVDVRYHVAAGSTEPIEAAHLITTDLIPVCFAASSAVENEPAYLRFLPAPR